MADPPFVASPCVGICTLEPETRLCAGCLRTASEIALWPGAGSAERLAIIEQLRRRRQLRGRSGRADEPAPRRPAAAPHDG